MRVLMISRSNLLIERGGDTIQIEKTAENLKKLGVEVEIYDGKKNIDFSNFNLLHLFNVIRPETMLKHIENNNLPFVLSTIFVDYTEVDLLNRGPLFKTLQKILGSNGLAYIKAIGRWVTKGDKITSLRFLLTGQKSSVKYLIKRAKLLLPNSKSEANRLFEAYNISAPYQVIPNGIETSLFNTKTINKLNRSGILCVARFEPLKNQLNLIKAVLKTPHKLTLIGNPGPNQQRYYTQCKKLANEHPDKIQIINYIPQCELIEIYSKSHVHVLASWFETTGLSTLEAASMGCQIIITDKGDTKEYFGENAFYCEPDSIESIKTAIDLSFNEDRLKSFPKRIETEYTWKNAAQKTLTAYKSVVNEN